MDDVLLQAMWRRPRGCLRELMTNARTKAAASGYKKSVAEVGAIPAYCCCLRPALKSLYSAPTAQVIEEDLLAVLEPAMHPKAPGDNPARRSVRGVSLGVGAAIGEPVSIRSADHSV